MAERMDRASPTKLIDLAKPKTVMSQEDFQMHELHPYSNNLRVIQQNILS